MDNQFFCYVSIDGDGIGAAVGRASLADDVAEIRRLSNAIEAGNTIWKSWALANGGESIGCGGDECRIRVPASKLGDIPALRLEYESAVGATCTVGVGRRLTEADKALLAGKLLGKDRVVTYSNDVEKVVESAKVPDEKEKISKEYLGKAIPGQNQGANAGFEGFAQPVKPKGPEAEGSEHSEAEAAEAQAEQVPNYRQEFKSLADNDSREQLVAQQGAQQENEAEELKGLKAQAAETIVDFQQRLPELEQLKQQDPELYQSLTNTMQTLLAMATKLFGEPDQVQKSEDLEKGAIPDGMSLTDFTHHVAQNKAKKQARIKELVSTTNGSAWQSKHGGFLVVGLDPHNRNQWRVTRIEEDGVSGLGHTVHRTHEDALSAADDQGANLHEEPIQAMKKDEDWEWEDAEDLEKMSKPTFKLPGLGLPDDRRPTDIITTQRQLKMKRRLIGNTSRQVNPRIQAMPESVRGGGGQKPTQQYIDQVIEPNYKKIQAQTRGGAGIESRGHSYALGGKVQPKDSHWALPQVQLHEDMHAMLSRVPPKSRDTLVRNLYNHSLRQLPTEQRDRVRSIGDFFRSPNDEERLASVISYLNDKNVRKIHQGNNKLTDEQALDHHKAARDFYGHMQHAANHLDSSWLTHQPGPIPPLQTQKSEHEDKLPGGEADDMEPVEFDPVQLEEGTNHELEHTKDRAIAQEIAMDHLAEDPEYYQKVKTIEKTGLLEAGKTGRHQVVLPVGSQIDAASSGGRKTSRIKIRDPETGKTQWRQVKAGMVMDDKGNPVSSRNQG